MYTVYAEGKQMGSFATPADAQALASQLAAAGHKNIFILVPST